GRVRSVDDALPHLSAWFEDVQQAHRVATEAHLARENALLNRRTDAAPVQRGLFDGRAVAAADRRSAADTALHDAARERIGRLQHENRLQLNITPSGVLVLWR